MKKVIGIDLGTTNSVIAAKTKDTEVLRNRETEELTRSCVGWSNGEVIAGRAAFQRMKYDPENTIFSIKRLMGAAYKDEMVQQMIAETRKTNGYYQFGIVPVEGGTEDAVAVVLGGRQWSPEQVSAEILKKLKADAEIQLHDSVTHAVITVPAYFTEKQKNATRMAAKLAGLQVLQLLAEPTAAAIAYGVDNLEPGESKTVLIYDFGGGTFDLSVLSILDGQYLELGTGGDRWLGGDDIDKALTEHIYQQISTQYKIKNLDAIIEKQPLKKRLKFLATMREEVERMKIELGSMKTTQILLIDVLEDEDGNSIDIEISFSREEFERLAKPFVQKSIRLIDELLEGMNYDMGMIDHILLVGGTSCIPLVHQMLSQRYGAQKVMVSKKPMLAVAEGAAMLAHRMGAPEEELETPDGGIEVFYSTTHDYFIELKDSQGAYYKELIIEKQTPLSTSVTRTFKTIIENQQLIEVSLFARVEQGHYELQCKGFLTLHEPLPARSEIIFDFEMDTQKIFHLTTHVKGSYGNGRPVVLSRGGKDAKAVETLSSCLHAIQFDDFNATEKEVFLQATREAISQVDSIGYDQPEDPRWEQMNNQLQKVFDGLGKKQEVEEEENPEEDWRFYAQLSGKIIKRYHQFIAPERAKQAKVLIERIEDSDDLAVMEASARELMVFLDDYFALYQMHYITLVADNIAGEQPADANKFYQIHDTCMRHFNGGRKDEAFEMLDQAYAFAKSYSASNPRLERGMNK